MIRSSLDIVRDVFIDSSFQVPEEIRILFETGNQLWPKLLPTNNLDFFSRDIRARLSLPGKFQKQVHSKIVEAFATDDCIAIGRFLHRKCGVLLAKAPHGHLDSPPASTPSPADDDSSDSDSDDSTDSSDSDSSSCESGQVFEVSHDSWTDPATEKASYEKAWRSRLPGG